jgi:hypothetical protein
VLVVLYCIYIVAIKLSQAVSLTPCVEKSSGRDYVPKRAMPAPSASISLAQLKAVSIVFGKCRYLGKRDWCRNIGAATAREAVVLGQTTQVQ